MNDNEHTSNGIVELPKGVYIIQTSGGRSGCCNYLKKKWWLRAYHTIFGKGGSFLLDAFGNPVHFNYNLNASCLPKVDGTFWHTSDMDCAILSGYPSSLARDDIRLRGSMVVPLTHLIKYPFFSYRNWVVTICELGNYRIGNKEMEYDVSFNEFMKMYNKCEMK
jgi:hypothetical protein